MQALTATKKDTIIKLYLTGFSYKEIADKMGTSAGSVANVTTDLKAGRYPEAAGAGEQVEQLRELSLDLKRASLTAGQCSVGLALLKQINEHGLDPADIGRWPLILNSIRSEDQAREFVQTVYQIRDVQERTGQNLEYLPPGKR